MERLTRTGWAMILLLLVLVLASRSGNFAGFDIGDLMGGLFGMGSLPRSPLPADAGLAPPIHSPVITGILETSLVTLALMALAVLAWLFLIIVPSRREEARPPLARSALQQAVDDSLEDLRNLADVRLAIIRCYDRMERVLAGADLRRAPWHCSKWRASAGTSWVQAIASEPGRHCWWSRPQSRRTTGMSRPPRLAWPGLLGRYLVLVAVLGVVGTSVYATAAPDTRPIILRLAVAAFVAVVLVHIYRHYRRQLEWLRPSAMDQARRGDQVEPKVAPAVTRLKEHVQRSLASERYYKEVLSPRLAQISEERGTRPRFHELAGRRWPRRGPSLQAISDLVRRIGGEP
jgi:hypothetical protein